MKKFLICSLLATVGSAQINVESGAGDRIDVVQGDGGEGGEDVNTRFFTSGNTALDSFLGSAAGTVAANVAGGLFNGYREKCRFRRQAADTKSGQTDVDTRLLCLNDLLPKPPRDCNRCNNCYDRDCRDCYQCRQPNCNSCNCSYRDCSNYCNNCNYNSGGSRPWSSSSNYRPSSGGSSNYRPSYRPTQRPPYNTGWRNGGGDSTSNSGGDGGVSFVQQ